MRFPPVRLRTTVLAMLAVAGAGCGADLEQTLIGPELAEAKGGNKGGGGGGDTSEPPTLVEFFVFEEAGVQMVHVVLEGMASEIGHQTSLDHFQNGHRDRGEHYEYFNLRAPRRAPEAVGGSLLHADVPFDGGILSDPFTTYFDHPYLDVDGSGTDPFVFQILVWRDGESGIHRLHPESVLDDAAIVLHGAVANSSFAVFQGDPAPNRIWVESLTVNAITCDVQTIRSGKGKDRTESTVTRVTVDGAVGFGVAGAADDPWVEFHLYDAATGTLSAASTRSDLYGAMVVEGTPGDIHLVLDYVYPDADWGVYDPASNTPSVVPDGLDVHFPAGTPLVVSAPASCPG